MNRPGQANERRTASRRSASSNKAMRSLRNLILHGLYLSLYSLVKYLAFPFAEYLRFFAIRLFSNRIWTASIADGVHIWFPWRVTIGPGSSLNQGTIIDGYGGVTIGSDVRIAAYVVINTADHNFKDADTPIRQQGYICAPVVIEDDVWVGAHVCINKGVVIGRGSVIGAGSVVTKDIPANSVAAGNPCQVMRRRGEDQ